MTLAHLGALDRGDELAAFDLELNAMPNLRRPAPGCGQHEDFTPPGRAALHQLLAPISGQSHQPAPLGLPWLARDMAAFNPADQRRPGMQRRNHFLPLGILFSSTPELPLQFVLCPQKRCNLLPCNGFHCSSTCAPSARRSSLKGGLQRVALFHKSLHQHFVCCERFRACRGFWQR